MRRALLLLALLLTACGGDITVIEQGDDDDSAPAPYEGDDPGECSDGADNDQDGDFDCDDADCSGAPECAEGGEDGSGCGQGAAARRRNLVQRLHPGARLAMLLAVLGGLGLRRRVTP